MLVQVQVAVEPAPLRRRIRRLLEAIPSLTVRDADHVSLAETVASFDGDLLVVSRSRVHDAPEAWASSLRQLPEAPEVVVLSEQEDPRERASYLAAGYLAVLFTGLPDQVLGDALRAVIERRRSDAIRRLKGDRGHRQTLGDFVAASPAMRRFLATVNRVVNSDSALLILGETGVGKEWLARAIHTGGPRSTSPFLAVNCAALPEGILESELFGHERGAFTGASRAHRGYFEAAHSGTIFLDEVAELPLHLQSKLLRVLEDHAIVRLGGERAVPVDVRVMAATNRDLEEEVAGRRFRNDLYYRLAVVTLTVPPLRERREDVPVLVQEYFEHYRATLGRNVHSIRPDAMEAMLDYAWPGNVRELINVVERAVLLCPGTEIRREDLPPALSGRVQPHTQDLVAFPQEWLGGTLPEARNAVQARLDRAYLQSLLKRTGGRVGEAARRAGINVRTLYDLMRRHGLRKEDFRHTEAAEALQDSR
jgi:two-component system response regulator AtoC